MSEEWGPWIYKGMPELGDYVQIDATLDCNDLEEEPEQIMAEGLVIKVTEEDQVEIVPEVPGDWVANRYRKRILKEPREELREQSVDA